MSRSVPGSIDVEGREFMYVEVSGKEIFSQLLSEVLSSCPGIPLPASGGTIEEKARITLQDNTSLLAISYKGDLSGWRKKIIAFCEDKRKKWGIPRHSSLALSDGTDLPLHENNVAFEP
jgi:hypothetical protein